MQLAVRRFAADLAALGLPADAPLAVAVSGGPDSLALLLLATADRAPLVTALTVDHGLRPESAAEAAQVARTAATLGVPHRTLSWEGPKPAADLQSAARAARYTLLAAACADTGAGWLLTAHHADDQAETLLLRLARGSGLSGLAGTRALRPLALGVTLARPLLGWRKAELVALCEAAGLTPAADPSNEDPRFDRTRARALLAAAPWLDAPRLAAAAAHLADAEAALAWTADRAWDGRASRGGDALTLDAADLPRELRFRLLARAVIALTTSEAPDGPELAHLLAALDSGRPATLAGLAFVPGPPWRITPAPPRR